MASLSCHIRFFFAIAILLDLVIVFGGVAGFYHALAGVNADGVLEDCDSVDLVVDVLGCPLEGGV